MTRIAAAAETRDFILKAKTRRVEIAGTEVHGFVVGPSIAGDEVLLAASLTMRPGEYSLTVSAISEAGEVRATPLSVVLDPLQTVPSTATQPPVVLLNGWQVCLLDEGLQGTFGSLGDQLLNDGVPVYFFDNCVECSTGTDCKIEVLGNSLGEFLNLIQYDNGAPVAQVDLVGHSMGGLIARAYLAGLQADGTLNPPPNPRVRKLVEIATPNFGSFMATPAAGTQATEMVPGSAFLWNLATWNQRGDDLRGVDALAIIGDAGTWPSADGLPHASDGVVSLTSASLGFARDQSRTRILRYCHTDPSVWNSVLGPMDCSGFGGIANVDEAPETGEIVFSFLGGMSNWMLVGQTPNQDPWLSQYGGIYFAYQTAAAQWVTDLTQVLFGGLGLKPGNYAADFYNEFVSGTGTFQATSSSLGTLNCGPYTAPVGYYQAARCKAYPAISSVTPLLSNVAGWVVQSGTTITITGAGFGQHCPTCGVFESPGPFSLQVSSWSDQAITAYLPATSSFVSLLVQAASGRDVINIMAAPAPAIAGAPASLTFRYTIGGAVPAGQLIQLTNSGGGVLNWTATSSASWLKVTPASGAAPSTLTVSVVPSGLAAATYSGSIQISSVGASNTPVTVPVSLVVAPAPPAAIAVTSAASYALPPVAPGMLAVIWWNGGPDFATATLHAPSVPLPTSMGGVSATITDAGGTSRNVSLLDVTPRQLNVVIPDAAQAGTATLTVNGSDGTAHRGTVTIGSVAPGLFSATADGKGFAVGQAWNVKADGSYTITDLCCTAGGAGIPINMGADTDTTLVVLYGTGLRGRTNLVNVSAKVGGQTAGVDYAGQQGSFVGLDQLNLTLPSSLRGQGTVSIALTVDDKTANALNIVTAP